jgi:hypothetical protein
MCELVGHQGASGNSPPPPALRLNTPHGNAREELADRPVGELALPAALLPLDPVPEADLALEFALALHGQASPDVQIFALGVHRAPRYRAGGGLRYGGGGGHAHRRERGEEVKKALLCGQLEGRADERREAGCRHREEVTVIIIAAVVKRRR